MRDLTQAFAPDTLHLLLAFFAALTLVPAMTAIAVEIYCRNSAVLLKNWFPESARLPFFVDLVRLARQFAQPILAADRTSRPSSTTWRRVRRDDFLV